MAGKEFLIGRTAEVSAGRLRSGLTGRKWSGDILT